MKKKNIIIISAILLMIFFSSVVVNAQFNGGGNRKIKCVDSTPVCPCVLPNGDCFDIDTPIDDELKILIVGGILMGLYKLHISRRLDLNRVAQDN